MTLDQFAERYRLKIKKDTCGDPIIPGRLDKSALGNRLEDRNHVYEHLNDGENILAVFITCRTKRHWGNVKKKLGLKIWVDDEFEGVLLLDPDDEKSTRLALKMAGIKIRRQLSEEQRAAIRERFSKTKK